MIAAQRESVKLIVVLGTIMMLMQQFVRHVPEGVLHVSMPVCALLAKVESSYMKLNVLQPAL